MGDWFGGGGEKRNVEATSAKTSIGMITQLAPVYRESAYHRMEEAAGISPSVGKSFCHLHSRNFKTSSQFESLFCFSDALVKTREVYVIALGTGGAKRTVLRIMSRSDMSQCDLWGFCDFHSVLRTA